MAAVDAGGDDLTPTSKTTVAHVITRLIVGGAQENTILSCAMTDPARFDSFLITGPQTGSEGELFSEARDRGVRVIVIPELVRQVSPRLDVIALRRLRTLLRAERPDVVHTHSSKAGILGRLAARSYRGAPSVVHTVHGWSFHDHMSRATRTAWIGLERLAASWCDRLVVVTELDLDKGLSAGIADRSKYQTIRSGMDLLPFTSVGPNERIAAREEWGVPPDVPVVGSLMRLSPQKDPLGFVEIAHRLADVSEARFVVVGDGSMRTVVEAAVEARGLTARFHFTGLRRDVGRMLAGFDVFLLPSLWEGLPKVVIQAMAAGIPVVATATDGVREVVTDRSTGLLFDPGDYLGGSAAVRRVLDEPALSTELTQAAARMIPAFDAPVMVRQLEDLYSELVLQRRR